MTILELENKLRERLNNGQNQEHDEELFSQILVLLDQHPEHIPNMFKLYMESLSEKGCLEAGKMFTDYIEGVIKVEGEGYGL